MSDTNNVLFTGRLVRAPEVKQTSKGDPVGYLRVAVNQRGRDNTEIATFIDVICFGAVAESCGRYLDKGSSVLVDGLLANRKYKPKDSETEITVLSVKAMRVQFLDSRKGGKAGDDDGE